MTEERFESHPLGGDTLRLQKEQIKAEKLNLHQQNVHKGCLLRDSLQDTDDKALSLLKEARCFHRRKVRDKKALDEFWDKIESNYHRLRSYGIPPVRIMINISTMRLFSSQVKDTIEQDPDFFERRRRYSMIQNVSVRLRSPDNRTGSNKLFLCE